MESRPYGSATVEQSIKTDIRYYVLINGQWTKVKKLRELTTAFPDKKNEILKFISDKKLSGDNEGTYEAVVAYYNSLVN